MLVLCVVITVLVRTGIILVSPTAFQEDPDAYRAIATTIAKHNVFGITDSDGQPRATAFRPPLYPLILSSLCTPSELPKFRVAAMHVIFAAVTSMLVFDCVLRLPGYSGVHFGRIRRPDLALLASVTVAIDPILLRQSAEVMTETTATLLSAAVIWAWIRLSMVKDANRAWPRAAGLGLLLGLGYLCRPPFLVWAVLICFAMLIVASRSKSPSRRTRHLITFGLTACMCSIAVITWTMRNRVAVGHPVWATSHGGYTLLLANNELFYDHLHAKPFGSVWDAQPFLNAYNHRFDADPRDASFWYERWDLPPKPTGPITENEDDQLCAASAWATIRRRPMMFAWSCVIRTARLWSPLPHAVGDRSRLGIGLVAVFYGLLYVAVAVTLWRHGRVVFSKPWWSMWLLLVTLTAVHAVYWSNLRMRAPAIPALAILAVMSAGKLKVES